MTVRTSLRETFRNAQEGRLRMPWRLVLGLVVFSVVMVIVGALMNLLLSLVGVDPFDPGLDEFTGFENSLNAFVLGASALVALWPIGRYVDRRTLADFGLGIDRDWWVDFGLGFALGAENVASAVLAPVAAVAFVLSAVAVGLPAGIALRHAISRYAFIARFKNALIILIIGGYMVAIMTGLLNELMAVVTDPMGRSPTGWFADLVLLGAPGLATSETNAVLVVVVSGLVFPFGLAVTVWLAGVHWFSDPVNLDPDDHVVEPTATVVGSEAGPVEGLLERLFGRPRAALVVLAYRRTVRAPMKLLYALIPLLMLSGAVPLIVELGEIPRVLVVPLLLAIVWGAGTLFVLNPLGDQGNVLPATLLSGLSGREFVGAHVIAGLLVALPVGVAVTALAVMFSPLSTGAALLVVLASPVLILLGSVAASGLGMAFPRFSAVVINQSTKTVVPSKLAFLSYTLYLGLTAVAGASVFNEVVAELTAVMVSGLLPFGLAISVETLRIVATVTLVPLALAPFAGAVYAIRRYDRYTVE